MQDPRAILITGASGGIGGALARVYASPGVRLALTGRSADRLSACADDCRASGAEVRTQVLDVVDTRALASWVEAVDRDWPLDLVIANAGITGGLGAGNRSETLADVHRMMSINFGGVCNTLHPVIPSMRRRRRGQLALMSSLAALRGLPYSPAYCASKAALKAYGEALRAWLHPEGIEVTVVLPGFVDTALAGHVAGPKPLQMTAERAARIIRRRLRAGPARIAFPVLLHAGIRLLASLPADMVDRVLGAVKVEIQHYE
ncbi:MAG TPA: SDR family NAD(P)-dependent oxidoreductase [Stellaceae bacterium]|nr:SDR family NAD(P)-dependent oxidoreductase [Stellaceae bacterium]